MKIKLSLIVLGLASILTGCVGVIERPAAVYVESRPVIVEPAYEIVVVHGVPVRRVIVAPRPIIIKHHRH